MWGRRKVLKKLRELFGRERSFPLSVPMPAETDGPLIRMRGISKVFGKGEVETHALRDVDLDVRRGEFLAVNGPSGSGKSTLLSIGGLLETPTSGTYVLNGTDVSTLSPKVRAATRNREIGFIFQSFNLIGDLNVLENVELPLTYQGIGSGERRERVEAALRRFDVMDVRSKMPGQLSGGHQQRVAVARAVVGRPSVLMADEPTGNLSSEQAEAVIDMLVELNRAGTTILLVTHDPRWRGVVNREVELLDGSILTPEESS